MKKTLLLCALLFTSAATPAGAQTPDTATLARAISAVIDTGTFQRVHWGIAVRDLTSGAVLYSRNAERYFVPASNLKLVVSAAAAHYLPADFRYVTSFALTGGDELLVHGTGDPLISARNQPSMFVLFRSFADSLRAHGVTRLGGVLADVSEWPDEGVNGDWSAYDLNWWYAARVGPLGFNDNAIDFRVLPGASPGEPARITWEPQSRSFTFVNGTRTVAKDSAYTLDFDRVAGTDSIRAYGNIPLGADARTESFAVRDPAFYFATVLAETLARAGITVDAAQVRVVRDPPAGARPLFQYRSPPLPQVIAPILQTSQNWFAEQLLKTVGHEVRREATWRGGIRAELAFLQQAGLDTTAFRLRDASGLSTGNLVTPAALAQLVRYIANTPRERVAYDALPVSAAATGSLRRRFTDLPGRVRAKTGSVQNVASLTGIVRTDGGRDLAFSIIANGTGLPNARVTAGIDEVVRRLAHGL